MYLCCISCGHSPDERCVVFHLTTRMKKILYAICVATWSWHCVVFVKSHDDDIVLYLFGHWHNKHIVCYLCSPMVIIFYSICYMIMISLCNICLSHSRTIDLDWIGLDLFNDDTHPSGHISRPTQLNVSQSGFHSLNIYSSLIILYTSGG